MSAVIGIRREDKSRWEARMPIVPADLAALKRDQGISFLVQPSKIRAFKEDQLEAAGAEINEDLEPAKVILGVKEIPPELLLPDHAYVFFAHVIKGQDYNMTLLQTLLDQRCTLIDYERILDSQGRRLVFFGRQAGQAGMIETFHALGRRLAWEGYASPFDRIKQAYQYDDLDAARGALSEFGLEVRSGLDPDLTPLVMGFAGYGNVSQGAQEIFDLFPHEEISPDDLESLFARSKQPRDRLFKVVFREEDLVVPLDADQAFELQDYYDHPEKYKSRFADYLPRLTGLVNCIYWNEQYPRLVSVDEIRRLWAAGQRSLRVIGDISCDIEGSIEFTHKATEADKPSFVYDPIEGKWRDGVNGRGVVVMAVDILPSELPRDASAEFSRALRGFVPALAAADYSVPFEELDLPPELKGAVITHAGSLAPGYRYLEDFLPDL